MNLSALEKTVSQCELCPLSISRGQTVFGEGSKNPDIFLIGEAPGAKEDTLGRPFVGRSGKLLDELLEEAGFSRDKNIYIGNMVKCRPPENRNPKKIEIHTCISYLKKQIELVNPKILLCVGRVAAQYFIRSDFLVTKEHGIFYTYENLPIMGTLHPASLLRSPSQTPFVRSDLLLLKEKISTLSK